MRQTWSPHERSGPSTGRLPAKVRCQPCADRWPGAANRVRGGAAPHDHPDSTRLASRRGTDRGRHMEHTGRTVDDASHDGWEGSLSSGSGKETASGRQAIAGIGPGKGASEEPIGSADRGGRRRETEWRAGDRRRAEHAGADTAASAWQITPAARPSSLPAVASASRTSHRPQPGRRPMPR